MPLYFPVPLRIFHLLGIELNLLSFSAIPLHGRGAQPGRRNVFRRAILIKSLANLSKLKMIYPVRLSDVRAQLNDEEKTIDVLMCFKERARRSKLKST